MNNNSYVPKYFESFFLYNFSSGQYYCVNYQNNIIDKGNDKNDKRL